MSENKKLQKLKVKASSTQWTWVWVDSRSWWWTGKPGVLWLMGSQRAGHNWATELNWSIPSDLFCTPPPCWGNIFCFSTSEQLYLEKSFITSIQFLKHFWRLIIRKGFPGGIVVENPPANAGDSGLIPGSGRSLGKEMATHSKILAWEILWTEEPGGLQSTRSQKSQTRLSG